MDPDARGAPEERPAGAPRCGVAGRLAFPLALTLAAVLHLALTFYHEPIPVIFSSDPNSWLDYDTHIEQTWLVTEALDRFGEAWAYDPGLLAGYPNGTIFDADNKGWELWTFALWKLGLPRGLAFNLFILLAHLAAPWVLFAAARVFRLDNWTALTAFLLSMAMWFYDGFPHWLWWIGMIAWGIVGYLVALILGLVYRFVDDGRPWQVILAAILLAAGHLIHPYLFVASVAPLLALYIRAFRRMGWKRHAALVGAAAFTVAVNFYWLHAALRFWHYVLDSGYCFQGSIRYLLTDFLGLIGEDPLVSGALMNRTGFRTLSAAAALACLWLWWRRRDDRFLPFAVGIAAAFLVTYLGAHVWITKQIQPYRFVMPLAYLTIVPASAFLVEVARSGALRRIPRLAAAVLGLLAFLLLPSLARDVVYFTPHFLPELRPLYGGALAALDGVSGPVPVGFNKHMDLRHTPTFHDFNSTTRWVESVDDGSGRFLVEWYVLGEHLAWRTDAQIIGGFHERNLAHASADIFRRDPMGAIGGEEALRKYLTDYAIKWIVLTPRRPAIERKTSLVEPLGYIPPYHRVYRTRIPVSFFAENDGEVKASLNRLEVTGTDPARDVVLRYHFLETLVCRPGCEIRREELEGDPVGFIRVPAPHPADFEVVNGY